MKLVFSEKNESCDTWLVGPLIGHDNRYPYKARISCIIDTIMKKAGAVPGDIIRAAKRRSRGQGYTVRSLAETQTTVTQPGELPPPQSRPLCLSSRRHISHHMSRLNETVGGERLPVGARGGRPAPLLPCTLHIEATLLSPATPPPCRSPAAACARPSTHRRRRR